MKPLHLLLFAPFLLVALVLVVVVVLGLSPLALVYFCFSRFCSLIEEIKPEPASRKQKRSRAKRLKIPSHIFDLIPRYRGKTNPDSAGQSQPDSPAF